MKTAIGEADNWRMLTFTIWLDLATCVEMQLFTSRSDHCTPSIEFAILLLSLLDHNDAVLRNDTVN